MAGDPKEPTWSTLPSWSDAPAGESRPAWSLGPVDAAGESAPPLERYQTGNLLGEGGMGQVRVAQDQTLGRDVALKVLAPHVAGSAEAAARLEQEARITAALDHPGIVAIHDLGWDAAGRPFYTMRLVRGQPLAHAITAATTLPARVRLLRYFLAACEAVAYAHSMGVIHRDLKPANILLGGFGETQVVDWGLARPIQGKEAPWSQTLPEQPAMTRAGSIVGTPAYMSPEQARGELTDTRSDVWSLGAILYEILCGEAPFTGGTSDAVLAQVRHGPPTPLRVRQPDVSLELAAITERAMAPQPEQRYPDAGALAADLARWFEGHRVEAYTYTPWDLLRRLVRAWRLPLLISAVALVALSTAVGVGWLQTSMERDRARAAEATALAAQQRSDHNLAQALVEQARTLSRADQRANAEVLAASSLLLQDTPDARGVLAAFSATERPRLRQTLTAPSCTWSTFSADSRHLLCQTSAGVLFWDVQDQRPVWTIPEVVLDGAFLTNGDVLLRTNQNGFSVHTPDDGQLLRALSTQLTTWLHQPYSSFSLLSAGRMFEVFRLTDGAHHTSDQCPTYLRTGAVHEDGQIVGLCHGKAILIGQFGSPQVRWLTPIVPDEQEISALAWLPHSKNLIFGGIRGRVGRIDTKTGQVLHYTDSGLGVIRTLLPDPASSRVAVIDGTGKIGVWDAISGVWLADLPFTAHTARIKDNELWVHGDTIQRWELPATSRSYRSILPYGLTMATPSPDGHKIALAAASGLLRVLERQTGEVLFSDHVASQVIKAVDWSADGAQIVIGGGGEALVQRFDAGTWTRLPLRHPIQVRRVSFLANNLIFALPFMPGLARWSAEGLLTAHATPEEFADIGVSPDRHKLVLTGNNTDLFRMRYDDTWVPPPLIIGSTFNAADIGDSGMIAAAGPEQVSLFDDAGRLLLRLDAPGAMFRDIALAPDERTVAAGGLDSTIWVWSIPDGRLLGRLTGHTERVSSVEYGPDSTWLVSASWDRSARIWDLSVLTADIQTLSTQIFTDWGMGLQQVLHYP